MVALAVSCASTAPSTQADKPMLKDGKGAPPVIDRQLFFGDPEISGSQLSPDGKWLSFIKPYKGVRNIWVKASGQAFDQAKPITADLRPVPVYFWSRDSARILYGQDKAGDENYHVYSVDPAAGPGKDSGVPAALDLTPFKAVRARIYSVPKNKPNEIIVGLNDRDPSLHDVYRVDIHSGERKIILKNTENMIYYIFDLEGEMRLAGRQTEEGGWEVLRFENDAFVPLYSCSFEETCQPLQFHKDGKRCYFISNKGADVDLTQLLLLDPKTGKTELVDKDPLEQVDFGGALFDEATDEIMATFYQGERMRIYPKDEATKQDFNWLKNKFPGQDIGLQSMSQDMSQFLVVVSSDVDPGSMYLYARQSKKLDLLYRARPELPSRYLAQMKPVNYKARDGLEIPAYLTLPRGVLAKNLPAILLPHGGPWHRDSWGYNGYAQFLANRGYAVLMPNFRGSTGYGKKFLNAGNKQWGTGAMQHDLSDGVAWLVDQGIADPKRVGIFGGSYGGYAVLAGVAFTPDLYACGIPYVGPSNIVTLIESVPAYWKPIIRIFYKRVGDPNDPADRKMLDSQSPLFFADQIKVPLLVIHGANDPRVKQAESDSIVVALRDKGHPVEYLVAKDEGHGFKRPENRLAVAVAMERFLAKHLGGRQQDEAGPEIAAQLKTITVDPAGVKMPSAQEKAMTARFKKAPLPKLNPTAVTDQELKYKVAMVAGTRKVDLEMTRKIAWVKDKTGKRLRIEILVKMSQGEQSDVYLLDAETLRVLERTLSGTAKMHLNFSEKSIVGEMSVGGRKLPFDVKLNAPVFGDVSTLEVAIAGMPLAEGYVTDLRLFETMSQKVRFMKLKVKGEGSVDLGKAKIATWMMVIEPVDGEVGGGGTIEIEKAKPHRMIRSQYKLPPMMGGGTVSSELLPAK
ncbi:MAG: S9 family peptidase [Deltaproteobacteria bacterium]|nr:S9 family peptidase [Deltaproteobacteria bacterium]